MLRGCPSRSTTPASGGMTSPPAGFIFGRRRRATRPGRISKSRREIRGSACGTGRTSRLEGLAIEIVDGSAVFQGNWEDHKSYGNTLRDLTLQYANWGVYIEQSVDADAPPGT